ncbi:MAG: protein kinase domain-containing protein [Gemmatimonadaceae bacterium]
MGTELREQLQDSLGDVYVLERELGGGGMSRVFVAHDPALGRRIVVKVLPPEMAASVSQERFRREIQLAASLLHPHIIPLLSAGQTGGILYYTMPYVEGESLRARLVRDWRLPVDEAVRLTREVAGALDYAHRRGIVHRDMKPDNILGHDGHALVTDFGIARAIKEASRSAALTTLGIAIGTPAYMSPEQGSGERELDGRSDIYALACVLYEMLTGSPPFTGMSAQAILMRHSTDPVPDVRASRADVPVWVERVVTKALSKDPSRRFATAAEFATALDESSAVHVAGPIGSAPTPSGHGHRPAHRQCFLAVLPFENMSADAENEYFSDGITEDIIAQLSKIRGFRVMSRTSTMRFKHRPASVREIGRELGVSHVMEGSVRRAGTKLRIVAQLIDAQTDEHIWAETYDREMTDIFAIQGEVAEQIASTLNERCSPTDRARLAKKPTDDLEAYNLFLLGRHHYNKVTPEDFLKALAYFQQAIDRDPRFARAYASLAEAKMYLGMGYWGVRPHEVCRDVFQLATRALELDPDSAEAHVTLGVYHEWYAHEWEKAHAELERAVDLNPSSATIRLYYAVHLCAIGRLDEAMVQRELASQLDPSAMVVRGNTTWLLYLARRFEDAVREGRSLRQIDPSSAYGAFSHGLVCAQGGFPSEAIAAFRDAVRLADGTSLYLVMLAYGLAVGDEHAEARSILADLRRREETEFIWPMGMSFAYAHLGEEGTALDYLERAYNERVGWMPLLGREPALDVLRSSPRFRELLRKVGPPDAVLAYSR